VELDWNQSSTNQPVMQTHVLVFCYTSGGQSEVWLGAVGKRRCDEAQPSNGVARAVLSLASVMGGGGELL